MDWCRVLLGGQWEVEQSTYDCLYYPGLPASQGAGIRLRILSTCPYGHNLASSARKFPVIAKESYPRRDGCKPLHGCHQPLNVENASDFMIQLHLFSNKGFRKKPLFQSIHASVTELWFHFWKGFLFVFTFFSIICSLMATHKTQIWDF